MSAFDTKCAWLPCRKSLGVQVWRLSKFSTKQFCSETCCQKWRETEQRNKSDEAQKYARLLARYPHLF